MSKGCTYTTNYSDRYSCNISLIHNLRSSLTGFQVAIAPLANSIEKVAIFERSDGY
ncbi:MAG: hypothetical protein KME17_22855 [Cyanosarcina radialis HA8281-LM2]|nr:hypothetical protein [Cyanosarcina radialis HA8281-LM2]